MWRHERKSESPGYHAVDTHIILFLHGGYDAETGGLASGRIWIPIASHACLTFLCEADLDHVQPFAPCTRATGRTFISDAAKIRTAVHASSGAAVTAKVHGPTIAPSRLLIVDYRITSPVPPIPRHQPSCSSFTLHKPKKRPTPCPSTHALKHLKPAPPPPPLSSR
jgi:hypothetical protein